MLVSCVMPTYGRRSWVPLALRCFEEQTYPRVELVVVDDGPQPCGDLVDEFRERSGLAVRYVHLAGRSAIGAKINLGIRMARGELIALWADDDYHARWRVAYQVGALCGSVARSETGHSGGGQSGSAARSGDRPQPGAQICGCDSIFYWDTAGGAMWRYDYVPLRRSDAYVTGGTMLFWREFWSERPFDDLPTGGEDNRFLRGRGPLLGTLDNSFYLATMHAGNFSPKRAEVLAASDNWSRVAGRPEDLAAGWWVEGVRTLTLALPPTGRKQSQGEREQSGVRMAA